MSATKEVDQLVRAIEATGKYVVESNGRHHRVVNGDGKAVVGDNGMVITIARTPSDSRWRENSVHQLIRAGVLEFDPKKPRYEGKSKSNLTDPETQAKKVAAIRARAAHYAAVTDGIRDRLSPLVVKVGGWGLRNGQVSAAEIGSVAMYWGRDRPDVFKTEIGAKASAQSNMKLRGACSESACAFWDAFVSAWEQADDPRRWYFDLAREMKGLPKTQVIVGGAVQPETKPQPKTHRSPVTTYTMKDVNVNIHEVEPVGQVALMAVYLMSIGSDPADKEHILEVGEQILALQSSNKGRT